ncbi:leukemia inhibitory factor receptor [Melanotaenia boesemani]|uniref:leukemia inhibitory factor receptor n=1 Tax=Melanotaenia boesemani TaxID=1250792 RepID=UPI001C040C4C|nr:leukemia inhibitory factor receptor [Melanotaenia boesemani]
MSSCGIWSGLLFLKNFSFRGNSHLLLLGLMIASGMTLTSHFQALGVSCKSRNISAEFSHCVIHPDGVRGLTCFGKYTLRDKKNCTWKPGDHTWGKKYTVISQQSSKKHCQIYNDITNFHGEIILFKGHNLTVMVFENAASTNCTKAILKASPQNLWHCGPPNNVFIRRHSGGLYVNVSWSKEDAKLVNNFTVRYKELGSPPWTELNVKSQNGNTCMVKNLNSSLVYIVQIRCVTSEKCSQCPWSEPYTVPSELTMQPVIVKFQDTDVVQLTGRRLISVTWKFSAKEWYDGYHVSFGKVSGEPPYEKMSITQPEIRLILSSSAYQLNISAYNNASISPAVSHTIPQREDMPGVEEGRLNVTVRNNTSFTIYWKDDMTKVYSCYSVEWKKKGHTGLYKSFHQNSENYKTLTSLPEPFEPYQRYSISLHMRPNKNTCNMKRINNSESTYGSTQFYFIEGSPVSAPTNISCHNVTMNSVVLQWMSIPDEDIRGFLQGYIIHYTEYHNREMSTETNLTIDPQFNSYKLGELKSGTTYQVQISGFTSAGVGVRSTASFFKTDHEGHFDRSSLIIVFAVVATVLMFGSPIIKRAKVVLWPSIPSPGSSHAVQKLDGPCQQKLLGAIATLKVEEWDTKSLQILEMEAVIPSVNLPSLQPLLNTREDEGDSSERTCNWMQEDVDSTIGDIATDDPTDIFLDTQRPDLQISPLAFSSDYTTMAMFQQLMPHSLAADPAVTPAEESEAEDLTVVKPGIDYVRQFSTSPTSDSEDMSTMDLMKNESWTAEYKLQETLH